MKKMSKNMKFNFDKDADGLRHIRVDMTWDAPANVPGQRRVKFDADMSIAILQPVGRNANGEIVKHIFAEDEDYFAFYGMENKQEDGSYLTPNGEVHHTGDCQTGHVGESATILLDKVPEKADEIAIIGTIHMGEERNQNWSKLNAHLSIYDIENDELLAVFDLGNDLGDATAVQVASFFRTADGWELETFGIGFKARIQDMVAIWEEHPVTPLEG